MTLKNWFFQGQTELSFPNLKVSKSCNGWFLPTLNLFVILMVQNVWMETPEIFSLISAYAKTLFVFLKTIVL